jgi:hypothetical protein
VQTCRASFFLAGALFLAGASLLAETSGSPLVGPAKRAGSPGE